MSLKIAIICGARPNFMKTAPLCVELESNSIDFILVNTGQHFDFEMSQAFFNDFKIKPDYNLTPSRQSIVKQFSSILNELEGIFIKEQVNLVIVVGDVNSTLAGALVANKLKIKLAHIEAGLRSYNKGMQEEHNRVMVDHISDYLFTTTEDGGRNLAKEGLVSNVYFVGNVMIDTLLNFLPLVEVSGEDYYFCTLHRAENIDNERTFRSILSAFKVISKNKTIYLPMHPRTKKMAEKFKLTQLIEKYFKIIPPLSYVDSLYYQKNAKLIFTDSGGIQEESSFLQVPCITLRTETERPITIKLGTNTIGGVTKESILHAYENKRLNRGNTQIPFWDGRATARIVKIIKEQFI